MLKKLHHTALACALLLAPAPAALAYEKACLDQKAAGYVAAFRVQILRRENRDGLDTHFIDHPRLEHTGVGRIHAHEHRCFNLADAGVRPGDRLRFLVWAHGGNTARCQPHGDYRDTHEGFWLMPDGPPRGALTFSENGGTTLHHRCYRVGGDLRMHSGCNATIDGMANKGCAPWRPDITNTVLHDIVRNDNGLGMLGSAIRRRADVNRSLSYSGYPGHTTPLHVAATENQTRYISHLIEAGATLNPRDRDGATPVLKAVVGGNREALEALLAAGASATYANHDGAFPLYIAARTNNVEFAKMLLEAGAGRNLNAQNAANGKSSLEIAKESGSRDVVALLRGLGAREKVYDGIIFDIVTEDRGLSALNSAVTRGANVNYAGENGRTPLHVIAERDLDRYLSGLMKNASGRLDFDAQDERGRTPLLAAVEANSPRSKVLRSLMGRANPNLADNAGNFPLYSAVQAGRRDIVQLMILNRRVDLNARHTQTGLTSLGQAKELAASGGGDYNTIVSLLERRGAEE